MVGVFCCTVLLRIRKGGKSEDGEKITQTVWYTTIVVF